MFLLHLHVEIETPSGERTPCPLRWLDSFCMRNFTNDAVFDDTLPLAEGLIEAGTRVPLDLLRERMEAWFRRKGWMRPQESLRVQVTDAPHESCLHPCLESVVIP